MNIAVLCAAKNSIYKKIKGLDVYDQSRNARTYKGSNPVICHPPCRGYSAFMAHFANPVPGEKDLALYCTEQIYRNGGILEHPKHSTYLYRFKNSNYFKIITIHQEWFGYPIKKATWLLMPKEYKIPDLPFNLLIKHAPGDQQKIFNNMTHNQRHQTTLSFAKWLINIIQINH